MNKNISEIIENLEKGYMEEVYPSYCKLSKELSLKVV